MTIEHLRDQTTRGVTISVQGGGRGPNGEDDPLADLRVIAPKFITELITWSVDLMRSDLVRADRWVRRNERRMVTDSSSDTSWGAGEVWCRASAPRVLTVGLTPDIQEISRVRNAKERMRKELATRCRHPLGN